MEPHWTVSFVAKACAAHDTVDFKLFKGVNHLRVAYKSLPVVEPWIAARFAGQPAPDDCK